MATPPAHTFFLSLILLLSSACVYAAIVEHTFDVDSVSVERLCNQQLITAVNGNFPGPTITANEGDTIIVHVNNLSPHDITIHWHGVIQFGNGWADGPDYITQCPIVPGSSYTYNFDVTGQEGTLWWHAHISYLRATVYGALVILPAGGRSYPFPEPVREFPIILGEWWDANVVDVVNEAQAVGVPPNLSDAFTINGQPGDLYKCSSGNTVKLSVTQGQTYLLRIVNAGLQSIMFFKIANHSMTIVAVDASYVNPYKTDVLTIAPGQSADVLFQADQFPASYYMAASVYQGSQFIPFNPTPTTAIIEYEGSFNPSPIMPNLPPSNDNLTAHTIFSNLTALITAPFWHPVPKIVDEEMFVTIGVGLLPCEGQGNTTCQGPNGLRIGASMNNVSFEASQRLSILEAFYNNVNGIYTTDFPDEPPVVFDYTNPDNANNFALLPTTKGARVRQFEYNSVVEIVFQNTALGVMENHPMHLHGYDVHVLAQGFGNFDSIVDKLKYNLVNPQILNTVAVPIGGWAAVRFQANNPGVWFIHCHLEVHVPWGLAGVFIVNNGPTPSTSVVPPPSDFPKC